MILGWRPRIEGLEHIPATGGAIFAGNHLSVADELFLGSVVPRHVAFWAKSDYFAGKGISGRFTKALMHGLGAIKVERAGGRAALTAFDGAIPVLKAGDMVAIYPEGRANDRTSLRALTDEVMAEIQKLTGQEYVPRYAPPKPSII